MEIHYYPNPRLITVLVVTLGIIGTIFLFSNRIDIAPGRLVCYSPTYETVVAIPARNQPMAKNVVQHDGNIWVIDSLRYQPPSGLICGVRVDE